MLTGSIILVAALMVGTVKPGYTALLIIYYHWDRLLCGHAASGRVLGRLSAPEDRPALFAAQFALLHGCWLITYPLAGWLLFP